MHSEPLRCKRRAEVELYCLQKDDLNCRSPTQLIWDHASLASMRLALQVARQVAVIKSHSSCCRASKIYQDDIACKENSKTTSWERAQRTVGELGLSAAELHRLARAPGRIDRTVLGCLNGSLTADSELVGIQDHNICICLRNVNVTFETAEWKWQTLTWISLNWNRWCISC